MQKEKIESISGLKGFSCLVIMLYHYRSILLDNGIWIADYGYCFVEVFVTISGFLMAYNYRDRLANMSFKDFFLKRYMKIMPLYWLTEFGMYVAEFFATALSGKKYTINIRRIIWEFSGFYTGWFGQESSPLNSPLWTVCCLLLCYILYFIIVKMKRCSTKAYIGTIVVLFIIGIGNLTFCRSERTYFLTNYNLLRCILSFLLGLLLFELFQKIPEYYGRLLSYIWIGVLLAGIILINFRYSIGNVSEVKGITIAVILVLCPCLLYSAIYIKPLKHIYSSRVLLFLGEISMDIYMWHWVVRVYLGSRPFYVDERTWAGWIALVMVTILVSSLSHYFLPSWARGKCIKLKAFVQGKGNNI